MAMAVGQTVTSDAISAQPSEQRSMLTRSDRLIQLPENVLSLSVSRRAWNGVRVDITESRCAGRVSHHLCYETATRLSALVEEVGSHCEPRLREDQPCPIGYMPRQMVFALAGMDLWGFSADKRFLKDITLSFDLVALGERLATEFDPGDGDAAAALFGRSHLDPGHAALRRLKKHRSIDATLR